MTTLTDFFYLFGDANFQKVTAAKVNRKSIYLFKYGFVCVPHLATYIFLNFQIETKLCAGIDPGIAFTPFPSSILDETRFEHTTLRS